MRKITLLFMFAAFAMTAQTYNFGLVQGYNGGTDYDITVFAYPDFTRTGANAPTAADGNVMLVADTGNNINLPAASATEYEGGNAWIEDSLPNDAGTLQAAGFGDGTRDFFYYSRDNTILINHDVTAGTPFPMFTVNVGTPNSGVLSLLANNDPLATQLGGAGFPVANVYNASIDGGATQDYFGAIQSGVGSIDFSLLSNPDAELTGIAMYPNPANNNFAITGLEQEAKVQIHDMNGKLILSKEQYTGGNIDVSQLQTGVYFVKIASDNKSTTEKLVVE